MNRVAMLVALFGLLAGASFTHAQTISREQVIFLTAEWKGERFGDGRPKVADAIVAAMKKVSIEEAWEVLRTQGYANQFEGGWQMDMTMCRSWAAVTAHYHAGQGGAAARITERGHKEGSRGAMNSWPIDTLQKGDVYVADGSQDC